MNSTPEQLRFASIPGCTIRADFAGGGLSSDLGPLLLKGVDRQIGLTERVRAAIDDTPPTDVDPALRRNRCTLSLVMSQCS